MPDWAELTELLAKDAQTPPNTSAPVVAQRYEQRFGRVQLIETIRGALHSDKARPGRAHRSFTSLPFDTVYTTNFDLLLEDAYAEALKPFRSLVGEAQLPFHAGQIASNVVKMHGDLRHEEHIVITQQDYEAFMDRYPVVATHLSAMLITRTPLFVGYSLSDPDFDNIRKVVRARLGAFERMSYVVQFDVPPERVEEALAAKLHIISLDSTSGSSRDEVLSKFFDEVQRELDTKSSIRFRDSRPDLFEEVRTEVIKHAIETPAQSSLIEATSRLCFVMMPFGNNFDEVYRMLIAPAVSDSGLQVLRADEMANPGFIMEQIRTAIQQSRLCIADITGSNANVLFEVGYAQAMGKPIVILAEEGSRLPFDIAQLRVLMYGKDLDAFKPVLQRAISSVLSTNRIEDAKKLLEIGQYRSAIAIASLALEQRLREVLAASLPQQASRISLKQLLSQASKREMVPDSLINSLPDIVAIRNNAIHSSEEPGRAQAEFILKAVQDILSTL